MITNHWIRPLDPGRVKFQRFKAALALVVSLLALAPVPAVSTSNASVAFMMGRKPVAAPAGFGDSCARHSWLCAGSGRSTLVPESTMGVVNRVNRGVNHGVHEISDRAQYGRDEVWALPTKRGGDCEDFALLKKKLLVEAGVPPESLLIATVLDRRRASHAVLIVRTTAGDFVLDNLTDRIKPWRATGYSFLKMQNPTRPYKWDAIFAGGIFNV